MANYFKENVIFLRRIKDVSQDVIAAGLGIGRSTWAGYENGSSTPNIAGIYAIAEYFDITIAQLLEVDLSNNVHLITKQGESKKRKNVHLNVHPTVHLNDEILSSKPLSKLSQVTEPDIKYGTKSSTIPITDINVAAGSGQFNSEYIEQVDTIRLPDALVKTGYHYLCVKIKGPSMSPTLQDGGFVIIRLLDRAEWAKMPDERLFVVSDMEGKSYLKRVKNRFKQNFIVLKSDNPDQASFPNFNLATDEINSIWYVEWYLSAKMPNIHDQYYSRLQKLEDKVDDLLHSQPNLNLKR